MAEAARQRNSTPERSCLLVPNRASRHDEDATRHARRIDPFMDFSARLQSAFGIFAISAIAWALSDDRRRAKLSVAAVGIGLQVGLALLFFHLPGARAVFAVANDAVLAVSEATKAGTSFVFGYLGGAEPPFEEPRPGAAFILAFQALPLILVVSALTSLLTYWRILPWVVRGFARVLQKTLGIGGALGFGAAANIFVGMIEAPLFIRPYFARLTRSELFVMMVVGMATIAGTVLVLYGVVLGSTIPDAAGHLLTASILSAPAAIMLALIMAPETETPTAGDTLPERGAEGVMDAIVRGVQSGVALLINVTAMLIVLVALVHLANLILGVLPDVLGAPLTWQRIFGWVFAPLCWLMGVPWQEAPAAGALMGVKTVLNEFLAYLDLAALPPEALSDRSRLIMTYALCGFANFGSLGVMVGGLATLAPERRAEIVALGGRSLVAGTLATAMTGAVIGLVA